MVDTQLRYTKQLGTRTKQKMSEKAVNVQINTIKTFRKPGDLQLKITLKDYYEAQLSGEKMIDL